MRALAVRKREGRFLPNSQVASLLDCLWYWGEKVSDLGLVFVTASYWTLPSCLSHIKSSVFPVRRFKQVPSTLYFLYNWKFCRREITTIGELLASQLLLMFLTTFQTKSTGMFSQLIIGEKVHILN